mmetsp:Transcript_90842/g.261751  ORF Transcript_90842/g.261751 Transcript_90842/m.261751 type:complete len:241 (+) Transcript_90842:437-1159(+)
MPSTESQLSIQRSGEPKACTKSVEERTPATPLGDTTTKWWSADRIIFVAHFCTDSSTSTALGSQSLCNPRNQSPTFTDNGMCSAKARKASRGVKTPSNPETAKSRSATSTQFCRNELICPSACFNVASMSHTGSAQRNFMTSAAMLLPSLRTWSSGGHSLQSARAKSKAESTPSKSPASSRTTRCRKAESPRAWFRNNAAASSKLALGFTVKVFNNSSGKRERLAFNHSPMGHVGSMPLV